eukprot:c31658_g1_i1 orf=44-340(+)
MLDFAIRIPRPFSRFSLLVPRPEFNIFHLFWIDSVWRLWSSASKQLMNTSPPLLSTYGITTITSSMEGSLHSRRAEAGRVVVTEPRIGGLMEFSAFAS